jgi:glycosyltransferase involved in cell wall biosynthesis
MAAAVTRLLRDPVLADSLGAAARARVTTNWTLEASAKRLESELLAVFDPVARCAASKPPSPPSPPGNLPR